MIGIMWKYPIIEEIAKEYDYDLNRIMDNLMGMKRSIAELCHSFIDFMPPTIDMVNLKKFPYDCARYLSGAFSGGSMRKREIYEKGIDLEVRFVEWEDVVGHEWKDGRLAITFRGIPKKVTIRDRDGDINRLLEGVYFA